MNKLLAAVLIIFFMNGQFLPANAKSRAMCNFESTLSIPIVLNPLEKISSKDAVEGCEAQFCVKNDVVYNGKILVPRGQIVTGKIETIATQGMNGIPAMIILDDFNIEGLDSNKLKSYYIRRGLNLTYMVLPIKWALTPLPPTGSLTNFIVGGPAAIKPKNDIKLKYYPEWECEDF